ncbi:hypothetical protein [Anabaena azotica]|uniref:Uncharacterized protein n=1 Tax=Anabaena azotica FACHB-119 TaxID=947527 RepID=A0ABR8CYF9_9NOST|nr:hypothetical protein [Anabaena azotica]MBD2499862.1 hypothetical protein [Anabaena azotica FACHB-119]
MQTQQTLIKSDLTDSDLSELVAKINSLADLEQDENLSLILSDASLSIQNYLFLKSKQNNN